MINRLLCLGMFPVILWCFLWSSFFFFISWTLYVFKNPEIPLKSELATAISASWTMVAASMKFMGKGSWCFRKVTKTFILQVNNQQKGNCSKRERVIQLLKTFFNFNGLFCISTLELLFNKQIPKFSAKQFQNNRIFDVRIARTSSAMYNEVK